MTNYVREKLTIMIIVFDFLVSGSSLSIPLPIIASSPHFLGADSKVQEAVVGINPDEDKHRSFMDIEPITGRKKDRIDDGK